MIFLGVSHYDIDGNGVINYYDLMLKKSDGSASDEEIASLEEAVNSTRIPNSAEFIYNHYYSNDGMIDADDYNEGIDKINEQIYLRDRSSNYYEYMFGIGWDFNIDVSKIVIPAQGYYQVVLPDGSNTTFKDDGNGGFECLNAHSKMTRSGDEYTVTNAAQSQYHFNADGELDWVKDANGNTLTISAKENNQRIVTDSTGRTYTITYNGNDEHSRILSIEDDEADRTVTYEYNGDFQLV